MSERRVWELLDRNARWAVFNAARAVESRASFPRDLRTGLAVPFYFYQKWYYEAWAEELDREAWLKDVKQRLGLVCCGDDGHELS